MSLAADQEAALGPVRAALLAHAEEQAARIVAQAREASERVVARARHEAEAAVAQARSQGEAQARPVAAAELGRSRRAARSVALEAERTAHDELAARIRAAVLALCDDPRYPRFRDRLVGLAGSIAGPQAVVTEHPGGGVVARSPGVLVDCSLPRLADLAVVAFGARISELSVR
jgi:vacuolar-type H+-ATPase subunit H